MVHINGTNRDDVIGTDPIAAGVRGGPVTDAADLIRARSGDDAVNAGGGDDTVLGGNGDDSLSGDAGDDRLDGGRGLDVAVYTGARSDYEVRVTSDGTVTVRDLNGAADGLDEGTDTLRGVERLRFLGGGANPDTSLVVDSASSPNAVGSSSMSADARLIAFASLAPDLVPDDTNSTWDVFLKDRVSGSLTRISTTSEGQQSATGSYDAVLSADGRYVAYDTGAQLIVKDLEDGSVMLPARDTEGREVPFSDWSFAAGGRFIAFATSSDALVPGDAGNTIDVFVRDLQTDELTLVSVGASGLPAQGNSFDPSISADGRYVAFASWAPDIVPDAPSSGTHIYVRDLLTGTTATASATLDGSEPSISANGRVVAFTSYGYLDPPPEGRSTTARLSLSTSRRREPRRGGVSVR